MYSRPIFPEPHKPLSYSDLCLKYADRNVQAADVATLLTPTEWALIGELLARGGADYLSNWTIGGGANMRYARRPPFSADFVKLLPVRPMNNPLVQQLFDARNCKVVVAFDDIDRVTAIWEAGCVGIRARVADSRTNPRALHPKVPVR